MEIAHGFLPDLFEVGFEEVETAAWLERDRFRIEPVGPTLLAGETPSTKVTTFDGFSPAEPPLDSSKLSGMVPALLEPRPLATLASAAASATAAASAASLSSSAFRKISSHICRSKPD